MLEPQLRLSTNTWLDLGEALLERLCNTADQALWDLFNQRRTPGQMLLAHLGDSGDGSRVRKGVLTPTGGWAMMGANAAPLRRCQKNNFQPCLPNSRRTLGYS